MADATELLERESQLSELTGSLESARSGEGRIALVYGEAGIGKTALLTQFTRLHAREARLFWGAGVALTALLAILGLAWTLSRRIIRPLRELSNDASVLASGNLSHRTAIGGQDEVGALAVTFNAMATALEVRHRELNEAREAAALEASKRSSSEQTERHAKETVAALQKNRRAHGPEGNG